MTGMFGYYGIRYRESRTYDLLFFLPIMMTTVDVHVHVHNNIHITQLSSMTLVLLYLTQNEWKKRRKKHDKITTLSSSLLMPWKLWENVVNCKKVKSSLGNPFVRYRCFVRMQYNLPLSPIVTLIHQKYPPPTLYNQKVTSHQSPSKWTIPLSPQPGPPAKHELHPPPHLLCMSRHL